MMKSSIIVIVCLLVCANTQSWTLWQVWQGKSPFTFVPHGPSTEKNLTNWVRNTPNSPHYSGYFSDFTNMYTRYMYWKKSDPNQINFCKPKYYLFNETTCRRDAAYWNTGNPEYCTPNTFGMDTKQQFCDMSNTYWRLYNIPCCFTDKFLGPVQSTFEANFWSVDKYYNPANPFM